MLAHEYIWKILRLQPKHISRFAQKVYVHLVNNIPVKVVLEIQDSMKSDPGRFRWPGTTIELEFPIIGQNDLHPSSGRLRLNTGYDLRRQVIVHDRNTNETTVHREIRGIVEPGFDYDYEPPSVLDFSAIRNESSADVAG